MTQDRRLVREVRMLSGRKSRVLVPSVQFAEVPLKKKVRKLNKEKFEAMTVKDLRTYMERKKIPVPAEGSGYANKPVKFDLISAILGETTQ